MLAAFIALACSGCGVVFIPTLDRFPDPVEEIQVRDAATGSPIANGAIRCVVLPDQYKGNPGFPPGPWAYETDDPPGAGNGELLKMTSRAPGQFTPEPRCMLGIWQWLWPLWSWATPGDFVYFGHRNRIIAFAPGYAGMTIEFDTGVPPEKLRVVNLVNVPSNCWMAPHGVLVFALSRKGQ